MNEPLAAPTAIHPPAPPGLRTGALGLGGVFMQALTHTAPATAMLFTLPFITAKAGVSAPLAYLLAFGIILLLGLTLTQLARHLPSAGGYYTYISRTVSPRAGFLTAWLYFLYDPTVGGFSLAFIGAITEETLRRHGIWLPWWLFLLLTGALVSLASYRGVEVSTKVLVGLGLVEIVVVLALSGWGLLHPGPGGLNGQGFNPRAVGRAAGLSVGVGCAIFALAGWEGVAPLAEESRDPRRTLPRAIIGAIVAMGLFLVGCSWALGVGWGTADLATFAQARENPTFALARRFWGPGWVLVLIALINSMLAVAIACNNAATRVWFAMARSGALPGGLAQLHPRFQTPVNAVRLQTAVMLGVGLGLGLLIGPALEFDFMGVVITFTLILIYSMGNLGVVRYYWRERRAEFSWLLHALFPLLGTLALLSVGYYSLTPWPAAPIGYAPWVVLGWLGLGGLVLALMQRTGRTAWLHQPEALVAPPPPSTP